MLLTFIGWILTGLIGCYGVSIGHLLIAESKGYEAIKFWENNTDRILEQYDTSMSGLIMGVLVWPIRIWRFLTVIVPYGYENYELK